METMRRQCLKWLNSVVCIAILATILFTPCGDARFMVNIWKQKSSNLQQSPIMELINKLKVTNHHISNVDPYTLNSPFYLPPFDSLSPLPQPGGSPPFTPLNPPLSPMSYGLKNPPPPLAKPPSILPSPPQHQPSPPKHGPMLNPPSPPKGSRSGSGGVVWCVGKPTVPDSIIQEAMDYACGSGADCKSIQPKEPCFQPNTLISHASFAFNSYWQNTKKNGGTCDFGGTAMLVTVDPSFGKCQFYYN